MQAYTIGGYLFLTISCRRW